MTILTVKHVTTYSYAAPVRLGEHRMMLRPRDSNDQRLLEATLDIEPRPRSVRWIHDVFDNCVAIVNFTGNTRSLRVESNIKLEHTPFDGPEVLLEDGARLYPFSYDGEEMPDLARSIERHYADPAGELDRWVQRFLHQGRPTETGTLLMTLTYAIKEGLSYERRTARGTQSPLQTLALRRGSCRDFATLMMEAARALGFAARFVSGYIYVPDRDTGGAISAADRRTRGAKYTCLAPAGLNSILPMALSAIEISFASRLRGRLDRPFPFTVRTSATPRTEREWSSRSMFAGSRKGDL